MNAPPKRSWWIRLAGQPAGWFILVATVALVFFPRSASYGVLSGWLSPVNSWLLLALLAPIVCGAVIMLAASRFWAWPYAYLLALWIAPASPAHDYVDLGMLVANAMLLMICLVLAECLGLSLGHWFSRAFAIGYFLGSGLLLAILALLRLFSDTPGWQGLFYLVCSVLFLTHALLQYGRLMRSTKEDSTEQPRPSQPEPVAGADFLPWTIQVDGRQDLPAVQQEEDPAAGENGQNQVR